MTFIKNDIEMLFFGKKASNLGWALYTGAHYTQINMVHASNQHSHQPKTDRCCALLFLQVPFCFSEYPFLLSVDFLFKRLILQYFLTVLIQKHDSNSAKLM